MGRDLKGTDRRNEAARERTGHIIRGDAAGWAAYRNWISNQATLARRQAMKRKTFILINGILNNPESVEAWTDEAESWIQNNTNFSADRMEYKSGVLTRRIYQNARVENLEKMVSRATSDKVILVGHSNGCDIIQRFLNRGIIAVHQVHLIAAASECDFKKNGLNKALHNLRVREIFIYCSKRDRALQRAKTTSKWLKWIGLGYGYLGLDGPKNVDLSLNDRVHVCFENTYDHGTWFQESQFDKTLKLITERS